MIKKLNKSSSKTAESSVKSKNTTKWKVKKKTVVKNKTPDTDLSYVKDDKILKTISNINEQIKIKDIKDVKKFMQTPLLPFCRYCSRGAGKVKWENSIEHSVKEWT